MGVRLTAATAVPAATAPTTVVLLHVVQQHVVPLALMAHRVLPLLRLKVVTSPLMVVPSASVRSSLRSPLSSQIACAACNDGRHSTVKQRGHTHRPQ